MRILNTWYLTQTFVVRWASAISTSFTVTNGTRQGSILSPLLFNVYIDELSANLKEANIGCYINGSCFNHLIYADDTVLVAPSPSALQQLLNLCELFVTENDLKINVRKSKYMVFRTDLVKGMKCPEVFSNNSVIDQVSEVKYLGVFLCDDFSDDMSMVNCIRGTYARGNLLKRNFKHCTQDVKVRLFQSYCSSFYCCALWCNFNKSTYKKVKVCHNNIFRFVCKCDRRDSISRQFVSFNVPNLDVIRRTIIYNLFKRVFASENELIVTIRNTVFFMSSELLGFWLSILF